MSAPLHHIDQMIPLYDQVEIAVRSYIPEAWRQEDQKPDIVLLHEALGCIGMWRDFGEKLAIKTGLRVIAYDREGYGNSTPLRQNRKPDYIHIYAQQELPALLDALNIQKPILFGHSDGGSIALLYAAKFHPVAIISEAGHVFVEDVTLAGIHEAEQIWNSTNLGERLSKYHGDKTEQIFMAWAKTWQTAPFPDWNIEEDIENIQCPTLVLQGAEDEYGSEDQVTSIARHVQGPVETMLLPNCKHIPHLQAQDEVLNITAKFIRPHI